MKRLITACLLIVFMSCGSVAYAADSECDCSCTKGGLGLKIGRFVIGFGVKKFYSKPGCDTNMGVGIGVGSDTTQMKLGAGYDSGVVGFGIAFKGAFETISMGFGVGYDYGDCRMVWPIEE